ncbi:hypothetical protein ACFQ0G_09405 [Streptomyces chiangmaiensis]
MGHRRHGGTVDTVAGVRVEDPPGDDPARHRVTGAGADVHVVEFPVAAVLPVVVEPHQYPAAAGCLRNRQDKGPVDDGQSVLLPDRRPGGAAVDGHVHVGRLGRHVADESGVEPDDGMVDAGEVDRRCGEGGVLVVLQEGVDEGEVAAAGRLVVARNHGAPVELPPAVLGGVVDPPAGRSFRGLEPLGRHAGVVVPIAGGGTDLLIDGHGDVLIDGGGVDADRRVGGAVPR